MDDFENYKLVHSFMHPDNPLKEWINKDNYYNGFSKDWLWLMPVVEKIESTFDNRPKFNSFRKVIIENNTCWIGDYFGEFTQDQISYFTSDTKIVAVWLAVVEFIKWYNTQNQ